MLNGTFVHTAGNNAAPVSETTEKFRGAITPKAIVILNATDRQKNSA
jgi:hypothetical protein